MRTASTRTFSFSTRRGTYPQEGHLTASLSSEGKPNAHAQGEDRQQGKRIGSGPACAPLLFERGKIVRGALAAVGKGHFGARLSLLYTSETQVASKRFEG